jgi:hypothetical protein
MSYGKHGQSATPLERKGLLLIDETFHRYGQYMDPFSHLQRWETWPKCYSFGKEKPFING